MKYILVQKIFDEDYDSTLNRYTAVEYDSFTQANKARHLLEGSWTILKKTDWEKILELAEIQNVKPSIWLL